jgi:hypothetical protein
MGCHAAAAVQLWLEAGEPRAAELVAAVLDDANSAPVPDRDRLLYATVALWTARRHELTQSASDALLLLGWDSAAIFEANAVCALFCFFNAWVDCNGVDLMSPAAYAASGQRLASGGY